MENFDLTPEEFKELLETDIQLVDVRTQEEYNEGHIQGAILLPVQELSPETLDNAGIVKDKRVLLYCRSGGRSTHAGEHMLASGYKVQHLAQGILAWRAKGFHVEQ
jgi:rhodanese-related sulfurtransferase